MVSRAATKSRREQPIEAVAVRRAIHDRTRDSYRGRSLSEVSSSTSTADGAAVEALGILGRGARVTPIALHFDPAGFVAEMLTLNAVGSFRFA
jgi:hypothetical protein